METQLAVIGGGPGGYAAAFLAADLGMDVVLVDREPRLGGVCLLRGCIPSKALLHVAKAMAETRALEQWGVRYGDPQVDLERMRRQKEKVIATLSGGLAQLARRRKVRLVRAKAVFEDSRTLRLEPAGDKPPKDRSVRFRHCVLASGSRPLQIPALATSSPRVMDSRMALELPEVPHSLLVVGGGYIGLELGTVYAALGTRVSVVEMTGGLLPGVDRDLVRPLQKRLEEQFEAIWLQTKVASLDAGRDHVSVTFEGKADPGMRRFDRVLVAVGREPDTEGLGLENTRVEVDSRGFVVVDLQGRTADPHILAIGDVAGQPMLAHKASHQGKVAVEALAGQPAEFNPRAIPAVVFTDPEIAWAGLTREQAQQQGRDVQVSPFPWAASGRAQAAGGTEGLTKWLIDPETQQVLGCGIVGPGAGDLISEAVLAIEMGAHVRDVAESVHPHPTFSETLAGAAAAHLGLATGIYRPRRAR